MEDIGTSGAVSLMTTDVSGVEDAVTRLHSTWASCLELGLGIYVLYNFVGAACFLIFIPTICMFHVCTKRLIITNNMKNSCFGGDILHIKEDG